MMGDVEIVETYKEPGKSATSMDKREAFQMMLERIRAVDWDDYSVAIPVFLTIIAMPLSFSIANGVSFGVISYAGLKVLSGRGREVDPLLYAVAALLVVRYIWLS